MPGGPYSALTITELFSPEGGDDMIGKDNLINFKKMWTWLSGYPAHDQIYYMEHVAALDKMWLNSCPLANKEGDDCTGCQAIWDHENGTLCTDPDSPLFKWQNTSREIPDFRSYYASQVAVLGMKAMRDRGFDTASPKIFDRDYIHSQLHG
jgi:hypothetical protein